MKQHRQFEQFSQNLLADYRANGKPIYCRQGCSGCCSLAVHAVYLEAVPVAAQLSEQQSIDLFDYIKRLKAALPDLNALQSYLKIHREAIGPCPFLDIRGTCSIYALRPLSCRALLSTRPAAWCTVDFATLDPWDKQAYESSLDPQIVAWPTHFVAATQTFARELENSLLTMMQKEDGWALAGNFAAMVWVEKNFQLSQSGKTSPKEIHDILAETELDHQILLDFPFEPET